MSSALAGDLIADSVPLRTVVETAAKPFGLRVRVCSGGDAPVTGRFKFDEASSVAPQLMEKGFAVTLDGNGYSIGCDQASVEAPQLAGIPSYVPHGSPLDPNMAGGPLSPVQTVPVEPPTYERLTAHYRDPSKLIAVLSKLPGLSVIADPEIPGPLLLAGPASIVKQASAFMRDLDRCPDQLEIQALVVSSGESSDRQRRLGIQLRPSSDTLAGVFDPSSAALINIPGLRAYLDASRSSGTVRQNSSFASRVLLGETVALVDGQEIPVRAATSVTDRETRADVAYRSIGHKLSVKVEAIDREAVVTVQHELSSLVSQTTLGPAFATRSTVSTMRVQLGEPVVVALAGTDLASKDKSRGIFSRSDATSVNRAGIYLVFALKRLPCSLDLASASPETPKPSDRKAKK